MGQRIVFTGGSGKAGRYVIKELLKHDHQILNLDVANLDQPGVDTLRTDLTQPGQVFSALTGQMRLIAPFPAEPPKAPDAVVHFAGIARNMIVPDDETFRINTLATYNVIDAACKLGVKKIIIASSGCIYGVTFASGSADYDGFPIDETLDVNPMDTYGISKLCIERIARGFARRFGVDIYCLRIGTVIAPEEYRAPYFVSYIEEPELHKESLWSYTDARDLGRMCQLALEKSGLGFQVMNAVNDTSTVRYPTTQWLKERCPNVAFHREMEGFEPPQSNAKMRKLLGFKEEYNWMMYYPEYELRDGTYQLKATVKAEQECLSNGVSKEGEVDAREEINGEVKQYETPLAAEVEKLTVKEEETPVIAALVGTVNPS